MKVYFASNSERLRVYTAPFEQASTGSELKEYLLKCLEMVNIFHTKKFGTSS